MNADSALILASFVALAGWLGWWACRRLRDAWLPRWRHWRARRRGPDAHMAYLRQREAQLLAELERRGIPPPDAPDE